MAAQPSLVRRAIPHYDISPLSERTEQDLVQREVDYESLSLKQLLEQAQDLYGIRDPANEQITRIKATIINKISPVYDNHNQLTLFDDQNGHAIRDSKDVNRIIVQHPEVPLQFRLKKIPATKWKVVSRSISQELERRNVRKNALMDLAPSQRNESEHNELEFLDGFTSALNWVIEQTQVRISHRLTGSFVAVPEANQQRSS